MNGKNLLFSLCLAAGCLLLNPAGIAAAVNMPASQAGAQAVEADDLYMDFGAQPAEEAAVPDDSALQLRFDRTASEDDTLIYYFKVFVEPGADFFDPSFFKASALQALCESEEFKYLRDSGKKLELRYEDRDGKEIFRTEADAKDCGKIEKPVHVSGINWEIPAGYPEDTAAVLLRAKEDLAADMRERLPPGALAVGDMEFAGAGEKRIGIFRMEAEFSRDKKAYMLLYLGTEDGIIKCVSCMSPEKFPANSARCRARVEETFGVKLH